MSTVMNTSESPCVVLDYFVVGEPNAIGRCLIQRMKSDIVLWEERFDPYNHGETAAALGRCIDATVFKGDAKKREKQIGTYRIEIHNKFRNRTLLASVGLMPNIVDVSRLVTDNPKLRTPVVFGLLREGEICNIIAPPKTGKSWLTLVLAIAIALGLKFLDTFETVPGNVLIIDNELHPETLANRIPLVCKNSGIDILELAGKLFVDCLRGRLVDLVQMENYFQSIQPGQFKLIVLDAFYRFLPGGTSENDNAQMAAMYNILDVHAERLDCCFVLIHHASKGNQSGKSVTDVGSGAGSISRAADCHLIIREHADEGLHVLDAAVRSWPPVEPISIRFNFPCWYPDGTEPALKLRQSQSAQKTEQKDKTDIDRICTEFSDAEFTANDVRSRLGMNRDRAAKLLSTDDHFEGCGMRPGKRKGSDEQKLFKLKKKKKDDQ